MILKGNKIDFMGVLIEPHTCPTPCARCARGGRGNNGRTACALITLPPDLEDGSDVHTCAHCVLDLIAFALDDAKNKEVIFEFWIPLLDAALGGAFTRVIQAWKAEHAKREGRSN